MEAAGKRSRFTIVELIVVVTMLAIVTAFAVPHLPAQNMEARSIATTTLGSRIRTNAAMAHAHWVAQGRPPSIELEGRMIPMSFGYPDSMSIGQIVPDLEGFVYDNADGVFSSTSDGRTPLAGCAVIYAAPAADGEAPSITIETAGC
jgi:MSHA pilin protein MshA